MRGVKRMTNVSQTMKAKPMMVQNIAGYRLQATGYRLQASGYGCGLQPALGFENAGPGPKAEFGPEARSPEPTLFTAPPARPLETARRCRPGAARRSWRSGSGP